MFDVLMYLLRLTSKRSRNARGRDKLTRDLTDAGFDQEDIYNALMWLETG